MKKPQGVVLYEGPSRFDGKPIVCVANCLKRKSRNAKTGDLVQTLILRADMDPVVAMQQNADVSVCGQCPLKGDRGHGRACYVAILQAPLATWRAWKAGAYPVFNSKLHGKYFLGRKLRIGSYGDPCAVPVQVWRTMTALCAGHVGYTHSWCGNAAYKPYVMASVESEAGYFAAVAKGWRTFRARLADQPILAGERACVNEAMGVQCSRCMGCGGAKSNRPNFAIILHGSAQIVVAGRRILENVK